MKTNTNTETEEERSPYDDYDWDDMNEEPAHAPDNGPGDDWA